MNYKYLDENYSSSQTLWGINSQLLQISKMLDELYQHDISLHVKEFHLTMYKLEELESQISALRHFASREKLACMAEVNAQWN